MIAKKCTRCGEVKNAYEYHYKMDGKFGLNSMCKECRKEKRIEEKLIMEELNTLRELTEGLTKEGNTIELNENLDVLSEQIEKMKVMVSGNKQKD